MRQAIRQAWWAPVAAFAAAYQLVLVLAEVFGVDADDDVESRVASVIILLVGAAVMFAGLAIRPERRRRGNVLILIGCFFAVFWFWTLILPIAGLVVAVGVLTSGWRDREPAPT